MLTGLLGVRTVPAATRAEVVPNTESESVTTQHSHIEVAQPVWDQAENHGAAIRNLVKVTKNNEDVMFTLSS